MASSAPEGSNPPDETAPAATAAPEGTAAATVAQETTSAVADPTPYQHVVETLEADTHAHSESNDSTYGDEGRSDTTSVASSIYRYRVENGRTYHAYKDGQYAYPNDDREQDRLDLQHHMFLLMFGNKLYMAPLKEDVGNVLDVGTGTGLWAIDFGDEHPKSQVLGTDLSPIQPSNVPPNVSFEVDDANETWNYERSFDFIHVRQHHCAIKEKHLFAQAFRKLNPGGWIEMHEVAFPVLCDDDSIPEDAPIRKWCAHLMEASKMMGWDLTNPVHYADWMRDAGLVNVTTKVLMLPGNEWPKGREMKQRGQWMLQNALDGLQGFTVALFTRVLQWSPEQVETFLVGVRKDVKNKRMHAWWPVYVVYGQKPEAE